MDSKEHSAPSFDTWSTTAPEPQWNLQMSTPTLKQESVQCVDEEETCIDIMYPSVALQSSEYVNYYDYKDHVLEQMKKESLEDELGQSVSSLNTKIVFDNKELSKFIDGLEVKHKNMEEGTSLNIKKEDKDIDYQFVIKTETLQQQGVVDNAGDTSVNCEQKTLNDSEKMEENTDDSHEDRKRKIQINDLKDEERKRKRRERNKRYRENKKNKLAIPVNEEKREAEKHKNREKARRYREKKKNSGIAEATESITSDSFSQKNAEKCKRYRDKKRMSQFQTKNMYNSQNDLYDAQIARPEKKPNADRQKEIRQHRTQELAEIKLRDLQT